MGATLAPISLTPLTPLTPGAATLAPTIPTLAGQPLIDMDGLIVGDMVCGIVGVSHREEKTGARGNFYIYSLANKTGEITAKAWSDVFASCIPFGRGAVVRVTAEVEKPWVPKGSLNPDAPRRPELKIVKMEAVQIDGMTQVWDLINPWYGDDELADARQNFQALIDSLSVPMRAFVTACLDRVGRGQFEKCPGARAGHHAKLGGLLIHANEVATFTAMAARTASYRQRLNYDIAVGGAILHDVGKTREYLFDGGPFRRGPVGNFVHHTAEGATIIQQTWDASLGEWLALGLDEMTMQHLRHIAVSHHGDYERQSCTKPISPEALLVHHADEMSAGPTSMMQAVESDETQDEFGFSTGRVPFFGQGVYHTPLPAAAPAPLADTPLDLSGF